LSLGATSGLVSIYIIMHSDRACRCRKCYHVQAVLALESLFTLFAVVLVMSLIHHMLVRCILRVKLLGASLASEAWRPVIFVVHVLIASILGTKGREADLAIVHFGWWRSRSGQ
jgi:hypothetical protein